jgi:hypothetical protein
VLVQGHPALWAGVFVQGFSELFGGDFDGQCPGSKEIKDQLSAGGTG